VRHYLFQPRRPLDPRALQAPLASPDCKDCAPPPCNSCAPGCATCLDVEDCRPKYIRAKHSITKDTAATCFRPSDCRYTARGRKLEELEAWVRPRGTLVWRLAYPAFDRDDDGNICFRWDHHLFALGAKRLEVEFRECGEPCGVVELRIRQDCLIDRNAATNVERRDFCPPLVAPGEITNVFDAVVQFTGFLGAVLESGATVLKLCPPDRQRLCSVNLCRPVELAIDDGVNGEIVRFVGCTNGLPIIERGVDGTVPRRFPAGARVRFVWTSGNVLAAQEGCS
jgi:hypothetical protein